MQVIDHQQDRRLERAELLDQPLDERVPVEGRCGLDLLDEVAERGAELGNDRQPEALRVPLVPLDGHPRDRVAQARVFDPRTKQDRLAAPGRRREQRHATTAVSGKQPEQLGPRDHGRTRRAHHLAS